ncbi:LptM family lipoprotein [Dethiobacter alkaliphilus]|uniref:LptM family lipoprotein n=1 Tax=Dethiobacter alkaliphilus TaxID=427926 RepID=UPI0022260BA9|nr:hypothetical protein [Dethiobacter alkaliphilus]MCW3491686.1 hypothetical protein [Dethiobacter alkaliphilus]
MKNSYLALIIVLLLFSLAGCGGNNNGTLPTPTNELTQKQVSYLEDLSLTVDSYEEEPYYSFVLTKDDLLEEYIWKRIFQNLEIFDGVDSSDYIGKTIDCYMFVVEGHSSAQWGNTNQSTVTILNFNNKIIGGFAIPRTKGKGHEHDGPGAYPLNGELEDFEEMAGMSFSEFDEYWTEKYSVD